MDRLSRRRRSCEENDRAAGILVRDDYVISRNGTVTREEIYPYVCVFTRAAQLHPFPLPRCVYRASCERTTHRTRGICVVSTGPRIGIRSYALTACRHACGFAIILSITRGVNLRRRGTLRMRRNTLKKSS